MTDSPRDPVLSLGALLRRFRWRIAATWLLVLLEGGLFVLFPLTIGFAIDGLLEESLHGVYALGGLALALLAIGAGRRFYDTRIYAGIYTIVAPELVAREQDRGASVSVVSARAMLATEFVEFLEDSFPEISNSLIGLVGTLLIILMLDVRVFVACMITMALIATVYGLSSSTTFALNKGYNHEYERQVDAIASSSASRSREHFRSLARWNIRLSDLETGTFTLSWLFLIVLVVFSIFSAVDSDTASQGTVLAIVMYVFNFVESIIALPLFYQQFVRLKEISGRLTSAVPPEEISTTL